MHRQAYYLFILFCYIEISPERFIGHQTESRRVHWNSLPVECCMAIKAVRQTKVFINMNVYQCMTYLQHSFIIPQ